MQQQRSRVYVWEFPVRFTHWINLLCILALSITGFYIGNPFIQAYSAKQYIMGWIRFIHFVAAYAFLMSFLIRIYWGFMGNKYANWRAFNPFSAKKIRDLADITMFYLLLKKEPPPAVKKEGHTACAIYVYLGLFILFVIEILTGFALYSQSHYGVFWKLMGGWLLSVINVQNIRLYHHLIMWFLIAFAILHVYIGWFLDKTEKNGLMGSIFSGYKFVTGKELE